jgi:outer membrane protein assembly factor BamB
MRAVILAILFCAATGIQVSGEENWPRLGGPAGSSHSSETDLPLRWTDENVLYKSALKGYGQSSPCIWGDRIFLTTALDGGRQRMLFAVDRDSGRILWEDICWTGDPEPSHTMNGHASATCATNGKAVVAFFGRGGLHGYSPDGQRLWSRDLGQFEGPWGTAASPMFFGDAVIQNCDSESPESSLLAVDWRTGETLWQTPRERVRGWSTPFVIETPDRKELILNSQIGVRSYDPQTGAELWWCEGFNGRGEPLPAYAHGLLIALSGQPGDIYAVRPGGSGDVTETHRVWHTKRRAGRDLPSPVVIGNYVLGCSMAGVLVCYRANDGRELWKQRIGPKFSASPLVSQGRAFFQNEEGGTVVIEPGPEMKIVAESKLDSESDELFRSQIVPCQGKLYIRSSKFLYCIGG